MVDQCVARQHEIGIRQIHLLAEQRLLGIGHVLPAHRSQRVERVLDHAAGVIIGYTSCTVVVQTVRRQHGGVLVCPSVHQSHIPAHPRELRVTVIEQPVAETLQRVALHQPHMPERIERVGRLVEIRAVAEHQRIVVPKAHVALQYLRVRDALLVKTQRLRPLQIHHRLRK